MATPLNDDLIKYMQRQMFGGDEVAGRKILIFSKEGIGKTVLSCRLGKHNLIITDEDGYTALQNDSVRNIIGHWRGIQFQEWRSVKQILQAVEAKQLKCECGEPFDNVILDTMTGMISIVMQQIIRDGIATDKGKVSSETAGRPDYLVSRERLIPVMSQIALMRNASVTMLMHQREGKTMDEKIVPDAHGAAWEVIKKYTSVIAWLTLNAPGNEGKRMLQVRANGNGVSAKTRYDFPSVFVTDDEFVAHVEKWKMTA